MNQHGEVQAVGGVNEKIEGFFDVCKEAGEISGQGVLLPASNVEHLMLRADVRQAIAEDRFRIYPISDINEAIELLTGLEAGERDSSGEFPETSFNRRVAERLEKFAEATKKRDENGEANSNGGKDRD
jgi:predicted ATP-dependent protease